MGKPGAFEFEPLFPMGFHALTLAQIKEHCVDLFPLSSTRPEIHKGLSELLQFLNAEEIKGTLWIDGSFTTRKIDPDDADVLLSCSGYDYDNGSGEHRSSVNFLMHNLKKSLRCQTFVLMDYPEGHDLCLQSQWDRAWYLGNWGWTDGIEAKGIVTLEIGHLL